jgi:FRG domain
LLEFGQMEEHDLRTWEEFEQRWKDLQKQNESPDKPGKLPLLFRGQENSGWSLDSTLGRVRERMLFKDYYRLISRIRPQIESLTDSDWTIPEYPEVEKMVAEYDAFSITLWSGKCPGYPYMAYLRHHGFPSPLLDWSRSPYVAAFFAFAKAVRDSKERVAIYVLSERPFALSGNRMPVVYRYGPYVRTHRRHVLQQSEYTLCLSYDDEWHFQPYEKVFDPGPHQQANCCKFTMPASEGRAVLKMLDQFNLNAFSLFGSEESLMETLSVREFFSRQQR